MGLFTANPKPMNQSRTVSTLRLCADTSRAAVSAVEHLSTQETSTSGRMARSPLYSTVRPRQFIVVPLRSTSRKTGVCRRHTPCRSSVATASDTSSETPRAAATASCQGSWATGVTLPPPDLSIGPMASQPFRRGCLAPVACHATSAATGQDVYAHAVTCEPCPAPPVSTPAGCDCLAATPPRPEHAHDKDMSSPASTWAPLPDFSVCPARLSSRRGRLLSARCWAAIADATDPSTYLTQIRTGDQAGP